MITKAENVQITDEVVVLLSIFVYILGVPKKVPVFDLIRQIN